MIEPKIRMIEPKDGSGFCLRNCQESCGSLVYREMQSESDGWPWRVPTLSNQSDLLVATLEKVCTLATSFSWQDNLPEEIQLWIIGMSSLSPGLLLVPPCLAKNQTISSSSFWLESYCVIHQRQSWGILWSQGPSFGGICPRLHTSIGREIQLNPYSSEFLQSLIAPTTFCRPNF